MVSCVSSKLVVRTPLAAPTAATPHGVLGLHHLVWHALLLLLHGVGVETGIAGYQRLGRYEHRSPCKLLLREHETCLGVHAARVHVLHGLLSVVLFLQLPHSLCLRLRQRDVEELIVDHLLVHGGHSLGCRLLGSEVDEPEAAMDTVLDLDVRGLDLPVLAENLVELFLVYVVGEVLDEYVGALVLLSSHEVPSLAHARLFGVKWPDE
mmetsp:Transcript_29143/g.40350  ORF Transcript_29143/g.40350 Transcript_29143/m.40350 type:complete len:208 (+) Transcript_29143:777-1400(+)